jgi:hypothetical protein
VDENPEQKFAEMMSTLGTQCLAAIFNALEPVKRKLLAEIDALKAEIATNQQLLADSRNELQSISDAIAERGKEFLELKARRRAFLLGDDIEDSEKFLSEMKSLREQQP